MLMSIDRKIIETMQKEYEKTVLLLGMYDGGESEQFLETLRLTLERKGEYQGITVKSLGDALKNKTPRQLLHYFLSNVSFVIADDTYPSGVLTELEYALHCGAIVAIISRGNSKDDGCRRSSWMTLDYDIHTPNFKVFEYSGPVDNEKINELLEEIIRFVNDRKKNVLEKFKKADSDYSTKRSKSQKIHHKA